jgi:zeaxanthin glucosyltransferase
MHFGLLCLAVSGHLNPTLALGRELQSRGHRVTLIQVVEAKARVLDAGLDYCEIGTTDYPIGTIERQLDRLSQLQGIAAVKYTLNLFQKTAAMILRDAPDVIRSAGIEALIIDQVNIEGPSIAEYLNLPWIIICGALMIDREPGIPPFVSHWQYDPSLWARLRNRVGSTLLNQLARGNFQVINEFRDRVGLPVYPHGYYPVSPLAQICQHPREFEFPRQQLPENFYFSGPHVDDRARAVIPFPYEKLTDRPLVYASLGTLQNGQAWIFERIAEACANLPVQLVISLGRSTAKPLTLLPGNPIVVPYAPQLTLLKRAALTITHAGMNTVLESLAEGVPMVAIPVTNDQPGVAARLVRSGAGERVLLSKLTVNRLRQAIDRVITQPQYRENAIRMQKAIRASGGVVRSADIVERVLGLT